MVFLSYSHNESGYAVRLDEALTAHHISVLRDKKNLKKNDCISSFMEHGSHSDYVVLLISDAYLKSGYCMFEAIAAYNSRVNKKLIPVVFPDADVFSTQGHLSYITYWQKQLNTLRQDVAQYPSHMCIEVSKNIRELEQYSSFIGDLLALIRDTNCILAADGDKSFSEILHWIFLDLLSREHRPYPVIPQSNLRWKADSLAIDFGTSYTLASVLDLGGHPHLIPNWCGQRLHRSTIEFTESGHYTIGTSGANAIRNLKRLLGSQDTVMVNGEPIGITLLIAMILKSVVRSAEEYTGLHFDELLMALPVDFTLREKTLLEESAKIAGLHIKRFVPESSAETLIPPNANEQELFVITIDLGGGTLDMSLACLGDSICEIFITTGDRHFGSIDFDRCLEQMLAKQLFDRYGIHSDNLTILAEQVKREFGILESVTVSYPHFSPEGNVDYLPLCITTAEFEATAADLFLKFDYYLSKLSRELKYTNKTSPDYIFLTGQGTKLHLLRKRIISHFPGVEIIDHYQENAVIKGLSIQNQILHGFRNDTLLLDTFPGSLQCTYGNKDLFLLQENCTIPTRYSHLLRLSPEEIAANSAISIEVFEVTVTYRKHILFRTQFTPKLNHIYIFTVDFDLNTKVTIKLLEVHVGNNSDIELIYASDDSKLFCSPYGNTFIFRDYCTVLYEYSI